MEKFCRGKLGLETDAGAIDHHVVVERAAPDGEKMNHMVSAEIHPLFMARPALPLNPTIKACHLP